MGVEYQIVNNEKEFKSLRKDWNNLLEASNIASPFLTWEWLYTWWDCYASSKSNLELCIILAKSENKIRGILPGYIQTKSILGINYRKYRLLGSEYESSDYLEIIIDDYYDEEIIAGFLYYLLKHIPGLDSIYFANLLEDRAFQKRVQDFAALSHLPHFSEHYRICPYIKMDGSYEDYFKNLSRKMRRNLRWYAKKLMKQEGAEFGMVEDEKELPQAMEALFQLHQQRFQAKDVDSIFKAATRKKFHDQISRLFLEKDLLRIFYLKIKEEFIAIIYTFEFKNQVFAFQSGMAPQWAKLSPQFVLYGHILEDLFNKKIQLFDFMRGVHDYKFRWATHVRNMTCETLGISVLGRINVTLKILVEKNKELLKKILHTRNNMISERI